MVKNDQKSNNWTRIHILEDVSKPFEKVLKDYKMNAASYFNVVSFYLDTLYDKFELEFIKYYIHRLDQITARQNARWNMTRSVNEGKKEGADIDDEDRVHHSVYLDTSNSIKDALEKRFQRKFKLSLCLEFWADRAEQVLEFIGVAKGGNIAEEINNAENREIPSSEGDSAIPKIDAEDTPEGSDSLP